MEVECLKTIDGNDIRGMEEALTAIKTLGSYPLVFGLGDMNCYVRSWQIPGLTDVLEIMEAMEFEFSQKFPIDFNEAMIRILATFDVGDGNTRHLVGTCLRSLVKLVEGTSAKVGTNLICIDQVQTAATRSSIVSILEEDTYERELILIVADNGMAWIALLQKGNVTDYRPLKYTTNVDFTKSLDSTVRYFRTTYGLAYDTDNVYLLSSDSEKLGKGKVKKMPAIRESVKVAEDCHAVDSEIAIAVGMALPYLRLY